METSLSLSFYSQKKIYIVNSESEEQKSCAPANENIEYEESDLGKPLKVTIQDGDKIIPPTKPID